MLVTGALADEVDAQAGVVPQDADLGGGHEARAQHAALVELGEPDRVETIGLRTPRHLLDVAGVDQPDHQPAGFEQIDEGPPVVRGRLDHDTLDALLSQFVGQGHDRPGCRAHVKDLALTPTGDLWVRDADADLGRSLGHIDRPGPFHHLLGVSFVDELGFVGHSGTPCRSVRWEWDARGPRSSPKY